MENPITDGSYKEVKQKAKELYSSIGRVWCPALGDYVVFRNDGFRHLIRKGGSLRARSEQKRRLALLVYAEDVLKTSNNIVAKKENIISHSVKINGERVVTTQAAHFWRFMEMRDGKIIKLIVRQLENKKRHFFSIFEE